MWLESIQAGLPVVKVSLDGQSIKKETSYDSIEIIQKAANDISMFITHCIQHVQEPNIELNKIWIEAAAKVKDLDSEVYDSLLAKSAESSNSEEWSKEDALKYNASLESVKNTCKTIIETK